MTCLLNYMPEEQSELQWLAAQAEMEHLQARHFHDTLFSSTSGCLSNWKLADQLQDTLWALSVVYSRTLTHEVRCCRSPGQLARRKLAKFSFLQSLSCIQCASQMLCCHGVLAIGRTKQCVVSSMAETALLLHVYPQHLHA